MVLTIIFKILRQKNLRKVPEIFHIYALFCQPSDDQGAAVGGGVDAGRQSDELVGGLDVQVVTDVGGVLLDVAYEVSHVVFCFLGEDVVDFVIVGVSLDAGPDLDVVGGVRSIKYSGLSFIEVFLVDELHNITEHTAVVHVVTIHQVVSVAQVMGIGHGEENGTGQGKVPVDVLVDILHIILTHHERIVNVGVIHLDPPEHILIDEHQLFQCRVTFSYSSRGLVLQKVIIQERAPVYVVGVPQGIAAVADGHHNKHRHE